MHVQFWINFITREFDHRKYIIVKAEISLAQHLKLNYISILLYYNILNTKYSRNEIFFSVF
jgi:hypothetical protein